MAFIKRKSKGSKGSASKADRRQGKSPKPVYGERVPAEGKELHRRALQGNRAAAQEAFQFFDKVYKERPYDHLIMAYYADCLSLMGRDSADHATMFGNAIQAMIKLDKAVNASPDDLEIRMLRANHSFRLPEGFFRRSATALGDYQYLVNKYEEDNSLFDEEIYFELLEKLGHVYERLDMPEDAREIWNKLSSITGDPKYCAKINEDDIIFDREKVVKMSLTELLQEGIRLHDLAVAGNKKAAKIAEALLKGVYEARPRDPIAAAYYGSSVALTARDSSDTTVMFTNTIKGLKLVKRAAARHPENPQLRLLRAYLSFNLPESFFHMTDTAIEDFRFLIQAYHQDKKIMPEELYWQVLRDLGKAYDRTDRPEKARKVWAKLARESDNPEYQALLENQ